MAHFAELNENNIVVQVLVVPDSEEHRGQAFLSEDLGLGGRWVQTSFNGNFRGSFAKPGAEYLPTVDKFMPLKPTTNPSFVFDEVAWSWVTPLPEPEDADWVLGGNKQPEFEDAEIDVDGQTLSIKKAILPENPKIYYWDEESIRWELQTIPTPPAGAQEATMMGIPFFPVGTPTPPPTPEV